MLFCASMHSKASLKLDFSAPIFCLWPFCSEGANYWGAWQWFCWGVHLCTDNWTWLSKAYLCKLSKPKQGGRAPLHAAPPWLMLCTAATGQGHAWAEYPADSSASFQDTVRLQLNIVCCRVQNKCGAPLPPGALPQALPSCSALHPLSTGACSLKKIWYSALEF